MNKFSQKNVPDVTRGQSQVRLQQVIVVDSLTTDRASRPIFLDIETEKIIGADQPQGCCTAFYTDAKCTFFHDADQMTKGLQVN